MARRLYGNLAAAADRGPTDFPDLLLTPGVGARTVRALAMVAEVVHGAPYRFTDPARFSFAHGGKDGHPFPVPLRVYDETIRVLKSAVQTREARTRGGTRAHCGGSMSRRDGFERHASGLSVEGLIAEERELSSMAGVRLRMGRPALLTGAVRSAAQAHHSTDRPRHQRRSNSMTGKARIAHLAGPNATIQNTPPLVTSNKARAKARLPLLTNPDGTPARFDVLRPQRLAAPVTVYVEQFSAHPLEADAAELYGPPDGYIDSAGHVHKERQSADDKPVYEVELRPEDGLYPLALHGDAGGRRGLGGGMRVPRRPRGQGAARLLPGRLAQLRGDRPAPDRRERHRQPDLRQGRDRLLSGPAAVRLYQGSAGRPPHRYRRRRHPTRAARRRFLPVQAARTSPPRRRAMRLARATNAVQQILASGKYDGAIWTEGSPRIEETIYWLNLLIDTTLPICGNAAQRPHGMISNDGPKNIVDSVDYIASRVWADEAGPQPGRRGLDPGAARLRGPRRPESRCAARRLCGDRRTWRHPRRGRP